MGTVVLDARGLLSPQPMLKIAIMSTEMKAGDVLEVLSDCPTFRADAKMWCDRFKRTLISFSDEGNGAVRARIQF